MSAPAGNDRQPQFDLRRSFDPAGEYGVDHERRRWLLGAAALATMAGASGCGGSSNVVTAPAPPTTTATRTWRMGFSNLPPRPEMAIAIRTLDLWTQRAELAVIHEELPWRELLGGISADTLLERDKVGLVNYYRSKGLRLVFMGELNDGLARELEAPQLRALGRSISEPAIQRLYRDYVAAVVRKLQPDLIGLAAETNLVRLAAPASLYAAVVQTANATAADLRSAGVSKPLFISVQVETAWGVLGARGPFAGIDTDQRDFGFMQWLGLSSYPYFAYAQPESIPADYYSRLLGPRVLPALVIEGGWPSAAAGAIASSAALQARYITRQAQLLDSVGAKGLAQLVFADPDLSSFPQPLPPNLPLFASIGLTDSDLNPKPALAAWDALFARRLVG